VTRIAVLAGDGIGQEVTPAAQRVLAAVRPDLTFVAGLIGAAAIGHQVFRDVMVYKSNVLVTSQAWRRIVSEVGAGFPDVALEHVLVDNLAMQLIRDPRRFDVIVAENTFGDILSDAAAAITGTIGTAASGALAGPPDVPGFGLYEPISGTAPRIAGRGIANPVGAILSGALLLRHSLGDEAAAARIERAVAATLEHGPRTYDFDGDRVPTEEVTAAIIEHLGDQP